MRHVRNIVVTIMVVLIATIAFPFAVIAVLWSVGEAMAEEFSKMIHPFIKWTESDGVLDAIARKYDVGSYDFPYRNVYLKDHCDYDPDGKVIYANDIILLGEKDDPIDVANNREQEYDARMDTIRGADGVYVGVKDIELVL